MLAHPFDQPQAVPRVPQAIAQLPAVVAQAPVVVAPPPQVALPVLNPPVVEVQAAGAPPQVVGNIIGGDVLTEELKTECLLHHTQCHSSKNL